MTCKGEEPVFLHLSPLKEMGSLHADLFFAELTGTQSEMSCEIHHPHIVHAKFVPSESVGVSNRFQNWTLSISFPQRQR